LFSAFLDRFADARRKPRLLDVHDAAWLNLII
jgi:hypothetical protein